MIGVEALLISAIVALVGSHIGLCVVVGRHSVHHESHNRRLDFLEARK